jgi:hypothetical protein
MAHYSHPIWKLKKDFLKLQEGHCAICGDAPPDHPTLDHDHRTGGYRGVLCNGCNAGLGFFCDSPELLQKAIQYLQTPRIARFPRKQTRSEAMKGHQNRLGHHPSKETRLKLSKAMKGKHPSKETRRKMRGARAKQIPPTLGYHHSEEARRRMSKARKGKPWSEARRAAQ